MGESARSEAEEITAIALISSASKQVLSPICQVPSPRRVWKNRVIIYTSPYESERSNKNSQRLIANSSSLFVMTNFSLREIINLGSLL